MRKYNSFSPATWDLQNIRPQATPFALLALLPAYDLDTELLERHYLILQKELHPDCFINKSPREAQVAEMMSAWVNQAYTTLKDPLLRAQALLKTKGCLVDEGQALQDTDLLEEAMEWRQRLEDLETAKQQEQFHLELTQTIEACERDFSQAWDKQDSEGMQHSYLRLSYLTKTFKQAKQQPLKKAENRA